MWSCKKIFKALQERNIDRNEVRRPKAEGVGASEIAKALKIGRASVYRVLGGAGVSIGIQSGPRIGIQKGPPFPTFRTISARPVGAGRGCGDGASAGCCVIISSAFETPTVIAGFDDVAVVGQAIE
jgi:hypothetical protein